MKYKKIKHLEDEAALREYVAECDQQLDREMENVIRGIEYSPSLRFLGLTGPTCAGKTTAARKITAHLESRGLRVHVISVDDFYFDQEYLQKRADADPTIEIDYDSEDTIDVDLLEQKTQGLLSCKETLMPRFDFKRGMRVEGERITPCADDVFLFEGIQILYPRVGAILNQCGSYQSIYIAPLSGLQLGSTEFHPNEIRLMRRLVRDNLHRNAPPTFTFYLWKSVRKNEEANIFPYVHGCHACIDSTLPYEIGMLKPYLEPMLLEISQDDASYPAAQKILEKIRGIAPISSRYMTENSLYKEFI